MRIEDFETLDHKIAEVIGKPIALEALWDIDNKGKYLYLSLYTQTGRFFWKKLTKTYLGIVEFYRQLSAQQAIIDLANEWGHKAEEKYGLTYYYPSDEIEEDTPTWDQLHLARTCENCGKHFMPSENAFLPNDICYFCYMKQEVESDLK